MLERAAPFLLAILLCGCADSQPGSSAPAYDDPKGSPACKGASLRMHAMCGVQNPAAPMGTINNVSAACREAIEDVRRYCE